MSGITLEELVLKLQMLGIATKDRITKLDFDLCAGNIEIIVKRNKDNGSFEIVEGRKLWKSCSQEKVAANAKTFG